MEKKKLKKRVKGRKQEIIDMFDRCRSVDVKKKHAIRMVAQFYELSESTIRRVISQ